MKDDRRLKRKVRNSYIVSTVSMALVLFLLGSVGYLIATAMSVAATLQESVTVTVELRNDADSTARASVAAALAKEELAREVLFLSKEEKAADGDFRKMFECEFEEILEENPLLDSYEVRLTARGEERAEVDAFIRRIGGLEGVDRVSYPERMADRLHATVGKIRFVLLLFGGALLVVSLILLANTIRLAILEALPHQYDEAGRGDQMVCHASLPGQQPGSGALGRRDGGGIVRRLGLGARRGGSRVRCALRRPDLRRLHRLRHDRVRRGAVAALHLCGRRQVRQHDIE